MDKPMDANFMQVTKSFMFTEFDDEKFMDQPVFDSNGTVWRLHEILSMHHTYRKGVEVCANCAKRIIHRSNDIWCKKRCAYYLSTDTCSEFEQKEAE